MKKFKILIPVYNDWQSLSALLKNIDNEIEYLSHKISIIVVDDASTFDRKIDIQNLSNIESIKIVSMKCLSGSIVATNILKWCIIESKIVVYLSEIILT